MASNLSPLELEMVAALEAALPFVERIANTQPTEAGRRERQIKATKALMAMLAVIAKAAERDDA